LLRTPGEANIVTDIPISWGGKEGQMLTETPHASTPQEGDPNPDVPTDPCPPLSGTGFCWDRAK